MDDDLVITEGCRKWQVGVNIAQQIRAGFDFRMAYRTDSQAPSPVVAFERAEQGLGLKYVVSGSHFAILFPPASADAEFKISGWIASRQGPYLLAVGIYPHPCFKLAALRCRETRIVCYKGTRCPCRDKNTEQSGVNQCVSYHLVILSDNTEISIPCPLVEQASATAAGRADKPREHTRLRFRRPARLMANCNQVNASFSSKSLDCSRAEPVRALSGNATIWSKACSSIPFSFIEVRGNALEPRYLSGFP